MLIKLLYFTHQELTRKVVEKEEGMQNQEVEQTEHDSEDEHTPST